MNKWSTAIAVTLCMMGPAFAQAPSTPQTNPPSDSAATPGMNSPASTSNSEMNSPNKSAGSLSKEDREFFRKASAGGVAEIEAAKLAEQQGTNATVKSFSQQMETDHAQVDDALNQLAQSKGVSVPDKADAKDEKAIGQLQKKQGAAFDKAFADAQVKGHEQAVALFRKATKSKDPDIAAFAKKTLPTLEEHLASAKAMKKEVTS